MRSRPSLVALWALALLLGACTAPAPPERGLEGDSIPAVDDLVLRGLLPLDDIEERLGEPDSVHSRVVPNRHSPEVSDTLFDVFYPALRVGIHRPGGGRETLSSVEVASDLYLRYPRVGIGTPEAELRSALGEPDEEEPGSLTYLCRECRGAEEPVTFVLEAGLVALVRFSYHVDQLPAPTPQGGETGVGRPP